MFSGLAKNPTEHNEKEEKKRWEDNEQQGPNLNAALLVSIH